MVKSKKIVTKKNDYAQINNSAAAPAVTIKNVANYCRVSTATVSLVLSRNRRISEKTADRVFDAIERLGYRPSAAARNLALNSTKIISLVIPQLDHIFVHPFFSLSINGIYDACVANGYNLQLEMASFQFAKRKRYLRLFQERATDGMIYIGSTLADTYLREIEENNFPFILCGSYFKKMNLSYVIGDNAGGARLAVGHLATLGKKRIAHIFGSFNIQSAVDRFEGYKEELKEKGLEYNPRLVVKGDYDEKGGFGAMKKILPYKPDAVFAGNDLMASGAIKAICNSGGLKVPEDISVVGMDDLPMAAKMSPVLTTIRYGIYEMAYRASERLMEMASGKITGQLAEIMPVKLIIRETCGAKKIKGKFLKRNAA